MEHKGTVALETQRLVLRRITVEDSEAAFRNWTSDPKVVKFLRWPLHASVETTREVLGRWQSNYRENSFYQWAIVPKGSEEPVGTIGVVDQKEELNLVHIGYCIGSKWWGQGITAEALGAVISFLFEQVKVNRIESQHDPENPNSGKVMSKCGLQYEGTLRQADSSNRGIVDAALYSLLAEEYFEKKKGGRGTP